jgi:endonuclease III
MYFTFQIVLGDTGVGKTVVAQDFMDQENAANDGGGTAVPITIVLSAQTTSRNMQDIFEGILANYPKPPKNAHRIKELTCFSRD